ncbi:RNA polymerase sigma factor [Croceiramulus getboli]|nr:RNA polymerase sigma factor [Flavobacteriaceae bacterium YJPT1-3]
MQPDELIERLKQQDAKALDTLYSMYSQSLFGVINTIVRDEHMAEEVLQDTFIKVWNNASSYSSKKGRFFTWMLNIARNGAIDKTRSKAFKNNKKNLTADYFVDILEHKSNDAAKVDFIGVQKYIDILEPICKKVIDLLFFKGYTQKETSEELDIPLGTVKTRNRICINKLREIVLN